MERLCSDAVKIFRAAVKAVKPETLIRKAVQVTESSELRVNDKVFSISGNVYVVGFGKAVLGMAIAMENVLGEHLTSGIISAPKGIQKQMESQGQPGLKKNSKITLFEGAVNNLPDEGALHAATVISNLVSSLQKTDLLIVLISGGGSALLPSPPPGITLEEKLQLIKLLHAKGATVQELNAVRKRLSQLKGGGLAKLAKPAKVISLILSDIIGDPLDLIASGPTVINSDDPQLPMIILKNYHLTEKIDEHILSYLKKDDNSLPSFEHVTNIIIGNNEVAANAALQAAHDHGYMGSIVTLALSGIAKHVGTNLISLAGSLATQDLFGLKQAVTDLKLPKGTEETLWRAFAESKANAKNFCLLCAGETVVEIKGSGIGGRNQELALSAALELRQRNDSSGIVLLSAGTDGIDGPTSAAGAIGTSDVINAAFEKGMDPIQFLENNDSFSFYQQLCNGKWHVIIGHTGTNVMDVVIILIKNES